MNTIVVRYSDYLKQIHRDIEDNLEYITEVEGIEIPKVWRDKIVQPLDFAIQQVKLEELKAPKP